MLKYKFGLLLCLVSTLMSAQNLQELLGKAFTSSDSSNYYFNKAKKACKTNSDLGHYYFCKNARCTDFNQFDSAVVYGEKAMKLLQGKEDFDALLTVYNNLNKLYNKQGKYEKAIDYSLQALRIAENKNDAKWKMYFLTNLCIDYHDYESYEKGIYYGKKALSIIEETEKDKQKHWRTLNAIAINYDDWNKPDSALYYHKKGFAAFKGKDTLKIPTTFNNIGNTLLKQKKFKEAKRWLLSGLKINELKHKNSKAPEDTYYCYGIATLYTNLAIIESELNNFKEAEKLFGKAYYYASKSKSAEKLRDIYAARAKFYAKSKNYQKAALDQEAYIKIRDSVFDIERAKTFSELEAKYQNEKKEKEIILAKSELIQKEIVIKNKNSQFLILFLITVGLVIISMLIYRQQKLKREQQKQEFELKSAIAKIENQNKLQEQRLQISRDLHDNIGSQLTFIISSVDNVKYAFDINNQKLDSKLSSISSFAKETIIELRDTIWAMNKSEITLEDLQSRIHNFVEKAKIATTQIEFNFIVEENIKDIKFSSIDGMNIYRTIQEAINNAIKYSEADHISIDVTQRDHKVKVIISDNGTGFEMEEINLGNGIANMKKRIKEIDGTFEIHSQKGIGTTIQIQIAK